MRSQLRYRPKYSLFIRARSKHDVRSQLSYEPKHNFLRDALSQASDIIADFPKM